MNVLDQIMGVVEAAELWGLSPDRVKGLCQNGEVQAKKIGNSWVLVKDQPNPKGGRKMKKESFTVTLVNVPGSPYPEREITVTNEKEAVELAEKWAIENKEDYVYINYFRSSDSQQGYLNEDGYGIHGEDWADKYK